MAEPETDTTGIDATGIDATGIDAAGIDATGLDAAGIDASNISARAAEVATDVSEADQPAERRRLVTTFTRAAVSGARAAGRGTRAVQRRAGDGTGWLADHVVAMAPRLKVRDAAALRTRSRGAIATT